MFKYSIDNKDVIIRNDNVRLKDLGEPMFKETKGSTVLNRYMIPESMIMRPDKISLSAFGSDAYTEILLKFNDVCNPFTVNVNDVFLIPTLESIYNDVSTTMKETTIIENELYDTSVIDTEDSSIEIADNENLIRNYHKYTNEQTRQNLTTGSKYIDINIPTTTTYNEPNITKEKSKSISVVNGVIQLGTDTGLNIAGLTGNTGDVSIDTSTMTTGIVSSLSGITTETQEATTSTTTADAVIASVNAANGINVSNITTGTTTGTETSTSNTNANTLASSNGRITAGSSDNSIGCLEDNLTTAEFLSRIIKNNLK